MTRRRPTTLEERAQAGYVGVRDLLPEAPDAYEFPEALRPEIEASKGRQKHLPAITASVAVTVEKDGGAAFVSPHSDEEAWSVLICEAFGSRSHAVAVTFLRQLQGLCDTYCLDVDGRAVWAPDEIELNGILAIIAAERPRTPLQAATLGQLAALHVLTMRAAQDAAQKQPQGVGDFSRLSRSYAQLLDAYSRLKGRKATFKFKIDQRKTVEIIHTVQHERVPPSPTGGASQIIEGQHRELSGDSRTTGNLIAPGTRHVGGSSLSGEDETGVVVSLAGHKGQGALSASRRRTGHGSAKR